MADNKKKAILLRISPELWAALQRWAADDLRSVNAQIEYVLREALRRRAGARPERDHPPTQANDSTETAL
jgi:hypothetical protein